MMETDSRNIRIHFRISNEEHEILSAEARNRKLSLVQTARIVLFEVLSGFDHKQENFLRRLDKQDEFLGLLIELASLAAAAGALPWEAEQKEGAMLREKLKKHIDDSRNIGKNLVDAIKNGKL
jgi:hypothetical protein